MRRAFTLIELLAVVGLMSVLGAVSVIAGMSVSRNLSDRAARQALVAFLRNAQRTAATDGVRTLVRFRRHRLAETETDDAAEFTRAVAVRAVGRVSKLVEGRAWDEFSEAGPICLDDDPSVVPLSDGPWKVGAPYGGTIALLELPRDYLVEEGSVFFEPVPGGAARMAGSVTLSVRRPDGSRETVGAAVSQAETEGRE